MKYVLHIVSLVLISCWLVDGFVPPAIVHHAYAQLQHRQRHHPKAAASVSSVHSSQSSSSSSEPSGLYRPFVEYAWSKLEESGLLEVASRDLGPWSTNEAIAKGMPDGSTVKISIEAKMGRTVTPESSYTPSSSVKYGRYALLETLIPAPDDDDDNHDGATVTTKGIQVMNLVVFSTPPMPVWGIDLVSLPGNRHLLAMDVQPMVSQAMEGNGDLQPVLLLPLEDKWKAWHEKHVEGTFEWGGDLPEAAQKFFSPYGLWTRLIGNDNAVDIIQTKVFDAFVEHLDLYLECVNAATAAANEQPDSKKPTEHHQAEYLEYRLKNDPARPMLTSLYGSEWTEHVLEEILFPMDRILK